jgi:aspartyl-tRNA(Asn)/glutamyl-tRNA(Gln) amidotransferase subunit C
MSLTESDIRQLARLARLHVSEDEAERLTSDLTEILRFIDAASVEDVSGVAPMIRPVASEPAGRDDREDSAAASPEAVRQAPDRENGFVSVPPVRTPDSSGEADRRSDSQGGSSA